MENIEPTLQSPESSDAAVLSLPHNSILYATLQALVAPVISQGATPPFANEVDALKTALLQSMPQTESLEEEKRIFNDLHFASVSATLDVATAMANHVFQTAVTAAQGDYSNAISDWNLAVVTYNAALQTGYAELQLAVSAAEVAYKSKVSEVDTRSRAQDLLLEMKSEVSAAISTYQAIATSAGSVLAAAAGNLIAAFATYSSAVARSEAERLGAIARAQQTFWQYVESTRDQP